MSFWDYAFTTLVIVELLLVLVAFVALFFFRRDPDQRPPRRSQTLRALLLLIGIAALLAFVGHNVNILGLLHPHHAAQPPSAPVTKIPKGKRQRQPATSQHVHFRWEELVVVLAVLAALGVVAARTRSRQAPGLWRRSAPEVLAAALDESLDDLRSDPDLRRAIIAAYARMETALAAAGLPREPAEAPLEYVERALLTLDASAAAVRRLTDLFEWARFSQHEPEPLMRDEAVDALVAVRDELRASEPALA